MVTIHSLFRAHTSHGSDLGLTYKLRYLTCWKSPPLEFAILDARGLLSTTSMLCDIKRTSDNVIEFAFFEDASV